MTQGGRGWGDVAMNQGVLTAASSSKRQEVESPLEPPVAASLADPFLYLFLELSENKFLLPEDMQVVLICYGSLRKLTHTRSLKGKP